MWLFGKTRDSATPDGSELFKFLCKSAVRDVLPGQGMVAMVLDAAKEFGAELPMRLWPSGRQEAVIKVADPDGGFIAIACTPGGGQRLAAGDLVMWVPSTWVEELANISNDPRFGWVGLIRAKVKSTAGFNPTGTLEILCPYDGGRVTG